MYNADKDKETSTIFLHKFTYEIHSNLKRHKKTNVHKSIHIGWVQNYQCITQHRISSPSETSSPATFSKQKFKSTIVFWGPKNKQPQINQAVQLKLRQKFRYIYWGKNIQHMDTKKWRSTLKFTKAKSFFTPNAFVHNIISNSASPIVDTQITKPFLQPNLYEIVPIIIKPKSLRNQI